MKSQKLFCAALSALLLTTPAMAAETRFSGDIALPEALADAPVVNVTVPDTGRFILNPYGLPVDMDGETSTEQIVGETLFITNNGENPVEVWVSAIGNVNEPSDAIFVQSPPQDGATEKEIFLYAEFSAGGQWIGDFLGVENQALVTDSASEAKNVLTLGGNAEGAFRLFGATAVNPITPWNGSDKVDVKLTFTFTADGPAPVSEPAEDTPELPVEPEPEESSNEAESPVEDVPGAPDDSETPEGDVPETPNDTEIPGGSASELDSSGASSPEPSPELPHTEEPIPEFEPTPTNSEAVPIG